VSLQSRLALSLMAVALIVVSVTGLGAVTVAQRLPERNVDEFLLRTMAELREDGEITPAEFGDIEGVSTSGGRYRRDSVVKNQLVAPDGRFVAWGGQGFDVTANAWALLEGDLSRIGETIHTQQIGGDRHRVISTPIGIAGTNEVALLQIARSVDDANQLINGLLPQLAIVGLVAIAAAGIAGWLIAGRVTRPIRQLTHTSETVARTRNLAERIPVEGDDEVARLATSFNTMLGALETSQRQQNQLVLDANHELRTPLTSLRTNIEVLQRQPNLPEDDRKNLLADVGSELNELTDLVAELVESATEVDHRDEPLQLLALDELVEGVAEATRRRTGRIVSVTASNPAEVEVRAAMISRAVRNLLSNAHKFSPDGRPILVTVRGARIDVADSGPGVAREDRDQIFNRFYRATSSRSKPGSGLGLAIVKQIAEAHGGTVSVASAASGGAMFTLDLSKAAHIRTRPVAGDSAVAAEVAAVPAEQTTSTPETSELAGRPPASR